MQDSQEWLSYQGKGLCRRTEPPALLYAASGGVQ
jgi:hypothetical protein